MLVKRDRTKNWLDAIERLLTDDEHYEECSRKSMAAVQFSYNLQTINKEREKFWKMIL